MFRNHARRLAALTIAALLLAPAFARAEAPFDSPQQASDNTRKWKKRWIASWIAVVAVNALDVQSSRGHFESNPLVRDSSGRFAPGKAATLKLAIGGAFFGTQLLWMRTHPEKRNYKPFTIANTVAAGALAGVAAHNYSLPAAPVR